MNGTIIEATEDECYGEWATCPTCGERYSVGDERCLHAALTRAEKAEAEVARLRGRISRQIETTQGAAGEDCRQCLRTLLADDFRAALASKGD